MLKPKSRDLASILAVALVASGLANAQTCDSLLGKTDCSAKPTRHGGTIQPSNVASDWNLGARSANTGLGAELSSTASNDRAIFGAITFSGGGTTCSGPLRSRRC
jgi:hypothetical protein